MSRTHNLLSCILAFVWKHRQFLLKLMVALLLMLICQRERACPGNRVGHVKILIVLVRRRQSSLVSCCSMFFQQLLEVCSGSGKMSAPDHNNQFPCALLRTGFRFAFAQSAVLKGALFRKQRGQESQVRLTTITNHLVRCCRLSSGLILLNVVVQKGVVTETTRSGIASAPDLFIFARLR